ncbi:MAG: PAS domain S-box protein [Prolixibacteraceae bacterium]|nr:PAS domain S-box protein [Prolixibacteraceae bacterium]
MIYETKSPHSYSPESLELHQKIIDALPIPIFYRNTEGIYILCNSAHENLVGLDRDKIIGKSVYDVHSKEMADIYTKRDKELLESPGKQIYESKFKTNDGLIHEVVFNKAVIRDNQNNIVGIVGSVFDITERKRAETKLERAKESMIISSHMLQKISVGIVIVNKEYKIVESNESFASLLGEETVNLFETIPGLRGADVQGIVPEPIFKMISNLIASGEKQIDRDLKYQNKLLHVSVVTLYEKKVVGAVIRDMSAPMLVRDEIINRAQRINRQNIDTVQKIAYLLGENASQVEELLNSIIESYRYGDDE